MPQIQAGSLCHLYYHPHANPRKLAAVVSVRQSVRPSGSQTSPTMRFFLAGIMQGSHLGAVLHNQSYRERLKALLAEHFPDAEVYDPLADHGNSLAYDDEQGRSTFFHHNHLCREVDVVVAFVPEASMGTAIEMWEAWQHGRTVLTISPLKHNWAVKFLSHAVYADDEAFEAAVRSGAVRRIIEENAALLECAAAFSIQKSDKQIAIELIDSLPDDVTLAQIIEELSNLIGIRRGMADADAGRVHTHEEVVKMFEKRFEEWKTN